VQSTMAPVSSNPSASTSSSDISKPPRLELDPEKQQPESDVAAQQNPSPSVHGEKDVLEKEQDVHVDGEDLGREISRIHTSDYPKAFPLAMIVVALACSIFLVALDMTIVATAIPRITDQFHSLDQVGWYGSAFFLTIGSFQATWGKLVSLPNLRAQH
jgi:MFS transporter, DHA2 family, glioxin efflux transporter